MIIKKFTNYYSNKNILHKEYFFSYDLTKGDYMNEIIPIKKDILFKTKIGEITDISLDYDYKINNELLDGTIEISGTYKLTEASVLQEEFTHTIPFSIAITKQIDKDTIKLEIDDFKYKYEKDILSVDISLLLNFEELKEEVETIEDFKIEDFIKEIPEEIEIETNINQENNYTNINNITNNIINDEKKYYKYKVYIIRPNDTIDTICNKYQININDLKEYNDITNINVGDKIIIPQTYD